MVYTEGQESGIHYRRTKFYTARGREPCLLQEEIITNTAG